MLSSAPTFIYPGSSMLHCTPTGLKCPHSHSTAHALLLPASLEPTASLSSSADSSLTRPSTCVRAWGCIGARQGKTRCQQSDHGTVACDSVSDVHLQGNTKTSYPGMYLTKASASNTLQSKAYLIYGTSGNVAGLGAIPAIPASTEWQKFNAAQDNPTNYLSVQAGRHAYPIIHITLSHTCTHRRHAPGAGC